MVDRRAVLQAAAGIGVVSGTAGCLGGNPGGTVELRLADESASIDGLSRCELTIVGVFLRPGDELPDEPGLPGNGVVEQRSDDIDRSQGRESFRFGDPQRIDLTEGGGHVFDLDIQSSVYEHLQLQISGIDAVADGDGPDRVSAPGTIGTTQILQLNHAFELAGGENLTFVAGVRPVRQNDEYRLLPVAESTSVTSSG